MSKKTCKDCLHCSIEDASKAYCSGMPWHYPFGGSDTVSLDKEACEHFLERDEPTVFQQITQSPKVLAEKLVYMYYVDDKWGHYWKSTILDDCEMFRTYEQAIAATIKELEKVIK